MSTPRRGVPSPRLLAAIAATAGLALVVGLGLLLALRGATPELDAEWMEEILEHRAPWWELPSRIADFVGGGWFAVLLVPIGAGLAFLLRGRRWSALVFVLASAVSALLVQVLKAAFARARPEDILVAVDSGSFPSGHTANAATIAVALGLLIPRVAVWVAGVLWIVAMALSRTYLGAHWVTDTVGGAVLGAAVAVLAWALFVRRVQAERGTSPG